MILDRLFDWLYERHRRRFLGSYGRRIEITPEDKKIMRAVGLDDNNPKHLVGFAKERARRMRDLE